MDGTVYPRVSTDPQLFTVFSRGCAVPVSTYADVRHSDAVVYGCNVTHRRHNARVFSVPVQQVDRWVARFPKAAACCRCLFGQQRFYKQRRLYCSRDACTFGARGQCWRLQNSITAYCSPPHRLRWCSGCRLNFTMPTFTFAISMTCQYSLITR